jgi:histidinol-phosphate/aromatic aminotransferase/cobyric acid decarboxylase-like protein
MMDEMRANFNTLLTEYPSGMYVNSLLAGKCFGVNREYIVPGNGAAELIKSLMEGEQGRIGVTCPTFEEYPNRCRPEQVETFVPQNADFTYTADDLMAYFADKAINTLLVVNPDNPSGNFIPHADLLRLAQWTGERNIRLIVDESFVDFSEGYEGNTLLNNATLEAYPHMLVMKSISKSFGVPGLRLGILASADKALIAEIKRDVAIWNINSFAEFYMQIFSKYEVDYRLACEKFQAERRHFFDELSTIPFLRVIPSQANYFLCEVLAPMNSADLTLHLLNEENLLIKDCSTKKAFCGRQYIRIAIRNRQDNSRLVEALRRITKG